MRGYTECRQFVRINSNYRDLSRCIKIYEDLSRSIERIKKETEISLGGTRVFPVNLYEVDFVSCKIPCVAICGRFYLKLISNEVYCSQGRNYDQLRNEEIEKVAESE